MELRIAQFLLLRTTGDQEYCNRAGVPPIKVMIFVALILEQSENAPLHLIWPSLFLNSNWNICEIDQRAISSLSISGKLKKSCSYGLAKEEAAGITS